MFNVKEILNENFPLVYNYIKFKPDNNQLYIIDIVNDYFLANLKVSAIIIFP